MSRTIIPTLGVVTMLFLVALATSSGSSLMISDHGPDISPSALVQEQDLVNMNPSVPRFTENLGQWPSEFYFKAEAGPVKVWFTAHGPDYMVGPENGMVHEVKVDFQNGDSIPMGQDRMSLLTSYYVGNESTWRTDVSSYSRIEYLDVWPGVNVIYRFEGTALKYDVKVSANSGLELVSFAVSGATVKEVDSALVLDLGNGIAINDAHPNASYDDDGRSIPICYYVRGSVYGFETGGYDSTRNITIDPLVYSTLVGGSGGDQATDLVLDAQGNAYVTGTTRSDNFPTGSGAFQKSIVQGVNDLGNAFLLKLDPTGTQMLYSTYIGGSGNDQATGIAVDDQGHAYVTGSTSSMNFPTTATAYKRTFNGGSDADAFVLKVDPTGSGLEYSTYVGGSGYEQASGIAIGPDGYAYVTGFTDSSDFPTSPTSYQPSYHGGDPQGGGDAFVFKLNPTGSGLAFCTYLGSDNNDLATAIDLDKQGNIYITGYSDSSTFPTTAEAYQVINGGIGDVFVVKLDQSGSRLIYSTLVGGSTDDYSMGMAVDDQGNVYAAGYTLSSDFPITSGAFQIEFAGVLDAFVFKIDPTGKNLMYSTFVGGSAYDKAYAIAVDANGIAYTTGSSNSNDFPISNGAFQSTRRGTTDAFVLRLDPAGSRLLNSTYLGGNAWSEGSAISIDGSGEVCLAGYTSSTDFPVSGNGFQRSNGGSYDAFILKLTVGDALPRAPTGLVGTPGDHRVTLNWQSPSMTGPRIDYYVVYQIGSNEVKVTAGTAIITGLVQGQSYQFYVRAHNTAGLGPASDMITANPSTGTVPEVPTHLVGAAGDQRATLKWDPPLSNGSSPLIGYYVYYGEKSTDTRYGGLVPLGTESASVNDLKTGIAYHFAVSAVSDAGEGNISAPISITTEEADIAVTGSITDQTGTPLSNIKVQLDNIVFDITDSSGRFDLQATPGNHTLTISGSHIQTETMIRSIPPGGVDLGTLSTTRAEETGDGSFYLIIIAVLVTAIFAMVIVFRKSRKSPKG